MQKRTTNIILATTLVVGGGAVALTPASAVDSDNPVKSRLANIKGSLSGLVEDGTLTQDQADKVANTLDEKLPMRRHKRVGPGDHLKVAAKVLGMTQTELRTKLKGGNVSLADVAKDEGVSTDELVKALGAEADARIADAVNDGRLTKAQAADRKDDLTKRITERVNADWPENRRPRRPRGDAGRPFDGPPPADSSSYSKS